MKKTILVSMFVIGSILLAACGAGGETGADDDVLKVVYAINGNLGDGSFIDSANRGLTQAMEELGIEYIANEAGTDPAGWEPAFDDLVQDPTIDIIVCGSGDMVEYLINTALEHPEKRFILFDNPIAFEEYEEGALDNVYAIQYKQNEGSFLVGYYAGLMSETGTIGAVGGKDIPVINDFMIGYIQGAGEAGISEDNVLIQYAGSWNDPAKGKELALTMYQQGADIVFQVAGGTGEGVFYAAEEADAWAIGVDSDQAMMYKDSNPDAAARILTSMLKNVDKSLYRAMELDLAGELAWGTNENLGIPFGVGLAYNEYYSEYTPQDVQDKIADVEEAVINGDIVVETVF